MYHYLKRGPLDQKKLTIICCIISLNSCISITISVNCYLIFKYLLKIFNIILSLLSFFGVQYYIDNLYF